MKKNLLPILFAFIAIPMLLTSCDEDQYTGMTLEGTWQGKMYMSYSYSGRTYQSTSSEIEFSTDPFACASGYGYWVDHYSGDAPYRYYASHFDWKVRNGVIYIYFLEDNYEIAIHDYRLNNHRFEGWFYDDNNTVVDFSLYHVDSPNWNDYYYGWSGWAKQNRTRSTTDVTSTDSLSTTNELPVRHCIKTEE